MLRKVKANELEGQGKCSGNATEGQGNGSAKAVRKSKQRQRRTNSCIQQHFGGGCVGDLRRLGRDIAGAFRRVRHQLLLHLLRQPQFEAPQTQGNLREGSAHTGKCRERSRQGNDRLMCVRLQVRWSCREPRRTSAAARCLRVPASAVHRPGTEHLLPPGTLGNRETTVC